uniref:Uncharacterized protein n=1 Tax=Trachysalambria curvirostris nimavirus TaxID=2984282 RepID=A0A9C7BR11_9VIRU|nr:MAG: hypothetical protein [Trachysalambria curvirostris nimavirus]
MNAQTLMELSVPEHLKEDVTRLIDSLKNKMGPTNEKLYYVAIATLIMDVWSPLMKNHVEDLILRKAVEENYLEDRHLKFVKVFDDEKDNNTNEDWIIKDQDDAMVQLVWGVFNMKEHFKKTNTHRDYIRKTIDRLGEYMPELHKDIVDRHDLSKFAFSQAIGYTLKWVHKITNDISEMALKLHLNNEPHHPQMWSHTHTPREKRLKTEMWTKNCCEFYQGGPYGLDVNKHKFKSEDMPIQYLYESYIDLVALEWQWKKNVNETILHDILKRKDDEIFDDTLVSIENNYLDRYKEDQKKIIIALIHKIKKSCAESK